MCDKNEDYNYEIEVSDEDVNRDSIRIKDRGFEFELFIKDEDQEKPKIFRVPVN